ncbi:MAG: AAA family ATPase [Chitinophagales bacterium]
MITYIYINGFKSFHEFEMEFTPFTVVAGANASGKSNLFDALMLLVRLTENDHIKKAFSKQQGDTAQQRGEFLEQFTKYGNNEYANELYFKVEMLVNRIVTDAWGSKANLKYTRLRYELKLERYTNEIGMEDVKVIYEELVKINHKDDKWIKNISKKHLEFWRPKVKTGKRGMPYIKTEEENDLPIVLVPQDGTTGNKRRFPLNNATRTVLSSFDTVDFPHVLAAKEEIKSWKFLQFNPIDLREPTDKESGAYAVSSSGKNLAATLYRIQKEDEYSLFDISRKLNSFLPNFKKVEVIDDLAKNRYFIKLTDTANKEYPSTVLSEGTLRFLALCILEYDDTQTGLLCFEEPENGIHPFRIKDMAKLLKDLSIDFSDEEMPLRQIIVNTHSTLLVKEVLELYLHNSEVSIWLSAIANRNIKIDDNSRRQEINITKMINLISDNKLDRLFSKLDKDNQVKMKNRALSKVLKYLETGNCNTIKTKLIYD